MDNYFESHMMVSIVCSSMGIRCEMYDKEVLAYVFSMFLQILVASFLNFTAVSVFLKGVQSISAYCEIQLDA